MSCLVRTGVLSVRHISEFRCLKGERSVQGE